MLSPGKLGKRVFYHQDEADMIAEYKIERVQSAVVLGLDKASVSTQQLIIIDIREWQQ